MKNENRKYVLIIIAAVAILFAIVGTWAGHSGKVTWNLASLGEFLRLKDRSIKILFVGDMMFDRNVAKRAEELGKDALVEKVKSLFEGRDLLVGNHEGTMTANESIAQVDHTILRFTFDPAYAAFLKSLHFGALSLANNHALDFGYDGYGETVENLEAGGMKTFGSPRNDLNVTAKMSIKDQTVCLIGYHDLYLWNSAPALDAIKKARGQCTYVIIYAHWGDEYKTVENKRQELLAHQFIDTGADLVMGSHPHVVQPLEIYKDRAIFYSLGNFIFDQDFSYETTHSLAVEITFQASSTAYSLIPLSVVKSQVSYSSDKETKKTLETVANSPSIPKNVRKSILEKGQFTLVQS